MLNLYDTKLVVEPCLPRLGAAAVHNNRNNTRRWPPSTFQAQMPGTGLPWSVQLNTTVSTEVINVSFQPPLFSAVFTSSLNHAITKANIRLFL